MSREIIKINNVFRSVKTKRVGLFKKAENVLLLNDISLSISENEFVVILGKNGSGKSTLLKCLTGILNISEGQIELLGRDPFKYRAKTMNEVGILFGQKSMMFSDLRAIDSLLLYKRVYNLSDEQFNKIIDFADSYLGFSRLLEKNVRKMSFGERMITEFVSIILHEPKLLVLDEPFIGLDVLSQNKLLTFIKAYREKYQATIILTTHQFLETLEAADRTIVINQGSIKYDGEVVPLVERYQKEKYLRLKFDHLYPVLNCPQGTNVIDLNGYSSTLSINTEIISIKESLDWFMDKYSIVEFEVNSIPIEKVVEAIYESNIATAQTSSRRISS